MTADETVRKNYPMIDRGDGRIELMCSHGIGHPSEMLSKLLHNGQWAQWMYVHGCDGCCDSAAFVVAEGMWYIDVNHAKAGVKNESAPTI